MKKIICLSMVVLLAVGLFAGCGAAKSLGGNQVGQEQELDQNLSKSNLKNFKTVDSKGKEVTQDILKDNDITMVNVWATWCGACVGEMEELQKLYKEIEKMPNVNMISICEDLGEKTELAKKILAENKCTFTSIQPDGALRKGLLNNLQYFPTTIFVDSEGNIIGEALAGAPAGDVAEFYMQNLKERLSLVKKSK